MNMKKAIFKKIIGQIREFNHISLFVHERPDFDAFGSVFGLKEFINAYFPDNTHWLDWEKEMINNLLNQVNR